MIAKIVQKCGNRYYWEDWAEDVAKIAQNHITRIKGVLDDKESKEYKVFSTFLESL